MDARYAVGFGDLTIHEVATDPTTNLAYMAYYNAGMRVVRYSRADGIEEMGKFIDDGRQQLLGRRAVHRRRGQPVDRRLRS